MNGKPTPRKTAQVIPFPARHVARKPNLDYCQVSEELVGRLFDLLGYAEPLDNSEGQAIDTEGRL